jgi:hypothetical protein
LHHTRGRQHKIISNRDPNPKIGLKQHCSKKKRLQLDTQSPYLFSIAGEPRPTNGPSLTTTYSLSHSSLSLSLSSHPGRACSPASGRRCRPRSAAPPPASGRPAIDPHTLQRCRPRAVVPTPSSATELCVVSSTAGSSVGADAAATLPWAATPPRCQVDPGGWLQRGSEPPPSSSSRQGEMGRRGREGKPLLAVAMRGGLCRPWQGGEEDGFWSHR